MKYVRYIFYTCSLLSMVIIYILIHLHSIEHSYLENSMIFHIYLLIVNMCLFISCIGLTVYTTHRFNIKRQIFSIHICSEFKKIFENLPIGVIMVDKDHTLHFINSAALTLLDLKDKPSEMRCSSICNNICSLDKIIEPIRFERNFKNSNKYIKDINLSTTIIPMILTDVVYYIEFLYDASYHQKILDELIKTCNFKSELISVASHEFRSPLYAMSLSLSSILDGYSGKIDNEVREDIEMSFSSVKRLISLVDDILDISKLENNKFEYIFEHDDICFIINTVIDFSKPFLKYNNIKYTIICDDNMSFIFDKQRMMQVFANLISNSIKFIESNGEIIINVFKKDSHVTIEFIDNGIGIDPSIGDKIFDKFFYTSNNLNLSGIGLGLYIVKNIILAHGGTISYESPVENNRGTKFIIIFPIDIIY